LHGRWRRREHEISARRTSGLGRLCALAIPVIALALGASGCVSEASVEAGVSYDYPVTRVDVVPADIYAYPRFYYGDGYAYLVGDRWYYESPSGWMIFRVEPRVLAERRVIIRSGGGRDTYYRRAQPRYYEERRPAPPPREPVERGRRYYPH